MPDLGLGTIVLLAVVAGVAGFVDAIAGGGGLLTLPALMLAGLPPHLALGTNKGQSVFGSGMALFRFSRSPLLDRTRARASVLPALAGSALGVTLVAAVPSRVLSVIVMVLLGAAAAFFAFRRTPAQARTAAPAVPRAAWLAATVAGVIGTYDGFFGPGTGTFLIVAYVVLWRDPLDAASANAKVVNFASNLAAVLTFAPRGLVAWGVALPMAVGQAAGGYLGAHLTVRRGQALVRGVVIAVCVALVVRLAFQVGS